MNGLIARALTLFACLAVTTVVLANNRDTEPILNRKPFSEFPMTLGPWLGIQDPPLDADVLRVLGVDDYISRVYVDEGKGVGLYMGFYRSQRQGDTIHSPLNCLPGAGWEPLSQTRLMIDLPAEAGSHSGAGSHVGPIEVNRYVVQKGLERQLVLYWYQSHGRVVASEYVSRTLLIHDAIRFNRTDGSLVRVIAPIKVDAEDGGADAEATAVEFVRVLFPALAEYIPS